MSTYVITTYTKQRAKALGVTIKASTKSNKKIDIFKKGVLVASVGAKGFSDFPTYMKTHASIVNVSCHELPK